MKDRIDKILIDSLKNDTQTPKELPERIIKTINEKCYKEEKSKNNKMNYLYKLAMGICACLIITSSVVFAKEIITFLFKLPEEYGQNKLKTAIENDYIQANETGEYIDTGNGILYRFNHVLLNDINLILSIDFIFNEEVQEYNGMSTTGLKITDENNNLIFTEDQNIWLDAISTSYSHYAVEIKNNRVQESIVLVANKFPKMKKIYLSFDSIILYRVRDGEAYTKKIPGNYNIEIPIDDKFNSREVAYYSFDNNINEKITIEDVKLTNTGLGITINAPEYEGMGYKCKLYDDNNEEIYSKLNNVSYCLGDMNKYFIWLDVSENFDNYKKFKIEIIDIEENIYTYNISRNK